MEVDNNQNNRKKHARFEWIFVIFGGGSIIFVMTYWILRASSYSYTDVIYLTADYEYGKYFGAAFDTVCGIMPALLIGIPMLIRGLWFPSQKNKQLPPPLREKAQVDEKESEINQ
jgi:hypothetical protein